MAAIYACFVLCLLAGISSATYQYCPDCVDDGRGGVVYGGGGGASVVYGGGDRDGVVYGGGDRGGVVYGGGGGGGVIDYGAASVDGYAAGLNGIQRGVGGILKGVQDGLQTVRRMSESFSNVANPDYVVDNGKTIYLKSADGRSTGYVYTGTFGDGQGRYSGSRSFSNGGNSAGGGYSWSSSVGNSGGRTVVYSTVPGTIVSNRGRNVVATEIRPDDGLPVLIQSGGIDSRGSTGSGYGGGVSYSGVVGHGTGSGGRYRKVVYVYE